MRVAHVLRSDHREHVGGDLHQLHASVSALRARGVDARAVERDDLDDHYDIVHLYNLQLPRELLAAHRAARRLAPRAAVVVSPIYWPLDRAEVRRERGESSNAMVLLHRIGPRRRAEWFAGRYVLRNCAAVLPNSELESQHVARYFRVPGRGHWFAVPNGIWVDRWRPAAAAARRRDGELRVSCIARLEPQKNQRRLVEAVHRLPQARLTLIGPEGERNYAASVLERMESMLGERARWVPLASHDELSDVLAETDVHVLPSFRETPGLASLEAAAAGCAVVATRHGSAEEYFKNLVRYAEPHSTASIAAAIMEGAANPCQPALRLRVERNDWSMVARRLAEVYTHVLHA